MDGKSISKLTGDNWSSWQCEIAWLLRKEGLASWLAYQPQNWEQYEASQRALAIIGLSVEKQFYHLVARQHDAYAAWQALTAHFGAQTMSQQMALRSELHNVKLQPGESVHSMTARVIELRDRLLSAGGTITEQEIVQRVMEGMPREYELKCLALQTHPGFWQHMTLTDLSTHLAEEQRRLQKNAAADEQAATAARHAMIAAQPAMAAWQPSAQGQGSYTNHQNSYHRGAPAQWGGRSGRGGRAGRDGRRGGGRGQGRGRSANASGRGCWECGDLSHIKADCPKLAANQQHSSSAFFTAGVAASVGSAAPKGTPLWVVDSGASSHMTGDKSLLQGFAAAATSSKDTVATATDQAVAVEGVGTAHIKDNYKLLKVQHVPALRHNLLSVNAAVKAGYIVTFSNSGVIIKPRAGGVPLRGRRIGDLFLVEHSSVRMQPTGAEASMRAAAEPASSASLYSYNTTPPDAETVHRRMGHPSYSTLAEMAKSGAVKGLDVAPEEFISKRAHQCEPCVMGKQVRAAHPRTDTQRQPGELLHSDIMGPFPMAIGGACYIITLIDDATGFAIIGTLAHKSEAAAWLRVKIKLLATLTKKQVKAFRSDNGGEYTSIAFRQFLEEQGIQQQLSAPYTPQMNGKAERFNHTLLQRIRTLLIDSQLSRGFWSEAAYTAVYALNRTVAQGEKRTPIELLLGQKPTIEHMKVFGCTAYYVQPGQQRSSKLDSVGVKAVMVGYDLAFKSYRLWDPVAHRVIMTPNVLFDEQRMATTAVLAPSTDPPFALEEAAEQSQTVQHSDQNAMAQMAAQASVRPETQCAGQGSPVQSALPAVQPVQQVAQRKRDGNTLSTELGQGKGDSSGDSAFVSVEDSSGDSTFVPHPPLQISTARQSTALKIPKRFAATVAAVTMKGKQADAPTKCAPAPEPAAKPAAVSAAASAPEMPETPCTLQEALQGPQKEQWRGAILDELRVHEENGTWNYVRVPANVRPVPNKWVFKIKTDQFGRVMRYKARLVAKGFAQKWGVDFDQTYSPVCRTATIRSLLALVAKHDWEMMQLDVTAAFLNGELEEEIYMQQPPGFEQYGPEFACRLRKAIYGLKQAPKAWYDKISGQLRSLGFSVSAADPGLFVLKRNGVSTFLVIHVDDMLVVGPQAAEVQRVKDLLGQAFKVTEVSGGTYLGMEITRDRAARTLHIGQSKYVHELLERFGMQNAKSSKTPADPSVKLTKEVGDGVWRIDPIDSRYMELVGCLMYLATHTRPDLSLAVGQLARFMQYATTQHLEAAKLVLRYLIGTASYGIRYGAASASGGWEVLGERGHSISMTADQQGFFGYADASYANDVDTRRSTTGYVFILNGGAVSWSSKLQPTVAVSTTEAEYMATAAAVKEALWFRKLLDDLGEGLGGQAVELKMDNQGSMHILMHPSSSARSKHIDVQYHFAREKVCSGEIKPIYVSTSEMVADCLTKAMAPAKFEPCKDGMGISKA